MPETLLSHQVSSLRQNRHRHPAGPGSAESGSAAAAPAPWDDSHAPAGLGSNDSCGTSWISATLAGRHPPWRGFTLLHTKARFYALPKPAIFLVHGAGTAVDTVKPPLRASRAPADVDVRALPPRLRFSDDIQVWSYDKGDFSIRMDIETGTVRANSARRHVGGGRPECRLYGAQAQIGGAQARISGAQARLWRARAHSNGAAAGAISHVSR